MPPRKSKDATATAGAAADVAESENGTPGGKGKEKEKSKDKDEEGISIEDLSLPRTMVQRLAKGSLPANTQVQKDAVTAMSKSATLFVNYLAESAHTHTTHASRRTIQPDDVFLALKDTEFDAFLPKLQAELKKYNEIQTGKRNEYRKKVKEGTLGVGSKIAIALGAPGTKKPDEEGQLGTSSDGIEELPTRDDGGDGRNKKRVRLSAEDGDVSMGGVDATNGTKSRASAGSTAEMPRVIDDSDAEDGDEEGGGEQGMGSEAGDSIPHSGSETESVNQEELEDEGGSEVGRDEEEEEDDEDSVIGGGGDGTEEDSGEAEGSSEGRKANGKALPRTVLVAMPRSKEGR